MLDYKTGVVGAGRVGAGMATLMAGHGCWVTIVGLDEEDLKRCRDVYKRQHLLRGMRADGFGYLSCRWRNAPHRSR